MSCKYMNQEKDYVYCRRDGSRRKKGCPCNCYEPSFGERFKKWLRRLFK